MCGWWDDANSCAKIRNASELPVYDVEVVFVAGADVRNQDTGEFEYKSICDELRLDVFPPSKDPVAVYADESWFDHRSEGVVRYLAVDPTFIDASNRKWRRDHDGELVLVRKREAPVEGLAWAGPHHPVEQ